MKYSIPTNSSSYLVYVAMLMAVASSVEAVNYTWNNSGTDWNTNSSWTPSSGSSIPDQLGDVAIFSTLADTNPNLSSSVSIGRLTANAGVTPANYTLTSSNTSVILSLASTGTGTGSALNYSPTSGTFTIDAPISFITSGSQQDINVNNSGGTVIINGTVTTANTITLNKSGAGKLTLTSASNSWNGDIQVSAGTLAISGSGVLGGGNLTMNGGTFDLSAISAGSYNHSASLVGAGDIVGGGKGLTINGLDADVNLNFDDVALTLSGTSTFAFTDTSLTTGTFDSITGANSSIVFAGILDLNFSGGSYNTGDTALIFDMLNYSGSFSGVTFSGLDVGQSISFDAATGLVTIIPEPSSYALLFGGSALLMLVSRRRRK